MNPTAAFSPPRVTANLAHAWGGVWRLTFRRFLQPAHGLTLVIGLGVLTLLLKGGPLAGGSKNFVEWTVNFYVAFLVPALAFMSAAGAMRDEMKSGTVDYVLTRPVPRPAFVVFKFVAHTLCAQVDFLISFGLVIGLAAGHGIPDLGVLVPKLLLCQLLLVAAFGGLGFLCGVISSRYVVFGLAYAGIIEAGVGQIPTQISRLSMTHQVREVLRPLWDVPENLGLTPGWMSTVALLCVFCVVMLAATAAIFSTREHSGPSDA